MNIIFLDIDGVMNNEKNMLSRLENERDSIEIFFDSKAYDVLQRICKATDASIVLTSAWRKGFGKDLEPLTPKAKRLANILAERNIHLIGCTKLGYEDRGLQILAWVKHNLRYQDDWVVVDDEMAELIPYISSTHLVKVDAAEGLLPKHYFSIVDKLHLI